MKWGTNSISRNGLPALPACGGVYLQTAEYGGGFLIYCAEVTSRPFRERFNEHTKCYLAGEFSEGQRVVDDVMKSRKGPETGEFQLTA